MAPPDFAFLFRPKETSSLPKLSKEEFSERRKKIGESVTKCLNDKIIAGLLFGSFVQGNANEQSDVDMFAVANSSVELKVITDFRKMLQNELGTLKLHMDNTYADFSSLRTLLHQPPFSNGFEILTNDPEVRKKIIEAAENY